MIILTTIRSAAATAAIALVAAAAASNDHSVSARDQVEETDGRVHALFDFSMPSQTVFPSDYFTIADVENNTGRRLNLPYPDCSAYPSDCNDLAVVNTLDGFGLQTRISIPFDGDIDASTVNAQSVFLIRLPTPSSGAAVIGVNQIVWDVATRTLHVETDALLEQNARYAVIVTGSSRSCRTAGSAC